ncbi:MAG: hypothetical protein MZV70_50825 [Desulfobacterales bacterium]|nr:hypothetical protein [Desulfobacterales bacterium]
MRQGNVYIGKGRKDDRSILVIPLLSAAPPGASRIEHLLLLHIAFKDTGAAEPEDPRPRRQVRAHQEHRPGKQHRLGATTCWSRCPIDELFGRSAEKVGEFIVGRGEGIGQACAAPGSSCFMRRMPWTLSLI